MTAEGMFLLAIALYSINRWQISGQALHHISGFSYFCRHVDKR